jgi:protein-disulfide isomerase
MIKIKMKARFLMVGLILLAVASSTTGQQNPLTSKGLMVGGQTNAPIKMEIFSCYQCPPCREFYLDTIRPLLKDYARDNKVCVIYYEFPLKIHDYSRDTARYAVAAYRLGQAQWQRVSEALYKKQSQWAIDGKIEAVVAEVLASDEMAKVKQFLKDPSIEQTIDQDIAIGYERKIPGTPTFFLYAKGREEKVVGKVSYPVLKDRLDQLLK